jgi:hypothetical protein
MEEPFQHGNFTRSGRLKSFQNLYVSTITILRTLITLTSLLITESTSRRNPSSMATLYRYAAAGSRAFRIYMQVH